MDQPKYILKNGTILEITNPQEDTMPGVIVFGKHKAARKKEGRVEILGVLGGYGGDIYWCRNEIDDSVAIYGFWELDYPKNKLDDILETMEVSNVLN